MTQDPIWPAQARWQASPEYSEGLVSVPKNNILKQLAIIVVASSRGKGARNGWQILRFSPGKQIYGRDTRIKDRIEDIKS